MENAATILAAAVGLVGYLYALGGIVVWLRIQTAQLAPDGATVGANNRHLLEVGARVVAFELFLVVIVGGIIATLFSFAVIRRGRFSSHVRTDRVRLEDLVKSKKMLGSIIGIEIGLLMLVIGQSIDEPVWLQAALSIAGAAFGLLVGAAMIATVESADGETDYKGRLRDFLGWLEAPDLKLLRPASAALFLIALGVAIFLVPLLQGTVLLGGTIMIYVSRLTSWPQRSAPGAFPRELLRSTGAWLGVLLATLAALAWVATPPVGFTRAVVKSADDQALYTGAYLDRDANGLYLGQCTESTPTNEDHPESTDAHIHALPPAESERLELGREQYSFDPGGRPSLAQVLLAGLGGDNADGDAPLNHPLRGRASEVCGPPDAPTPPR